jgi:hypothetical protein
MQDPMTKKLSLKSQCYHQDFLYYYQQMIYDLIILFPTLTLATLQITPYMNQENAQSPYVLQHMPCHRIF